MVNRVSPQTIRLGLLKLACCTDYSVSCYRWWLWYLHWALGLPWRRQALFSCIVLQYPACNESTLHFLVFFFLIKMTKSCNYHKVLCLLGTGKYPIKAQSKLKTPSKILFLCLPRPSAKMALTNHVPIAFQYQETNSVLPVFL